MSFNRCLTVNIDDLVFFIRPEFYENNTMRIGLDRVYQGVVVEISGTSDLDIMITVVDACGNSFSACQELFSTNLSQILDVINCYDGVIAEFDWTAFLREKCGNKLRYPYEIIFPYSKDQHFDSVFTEWGYKNDVTLKRCLFTFGHYGTKISYQLSAIDGVIYSAKSYEINPEKEPFKIKSLA